MPCALAFAATAAPDSLLIDAMTSTLTPLEIMPSASVENFCSSPWAFWMSASRPSACIAAVSSGLSKPSHRAELCVSGRITPTLVPPAAGAAALGALPPLLGAAAFCPQAASAIVRPSPAASTAVRLTAVVLVRIRRPFPLRWGPRRGNVVSGNVCGPTTWCQPYWIVQVDAIASRFGLVTPDLLCMGAEPQAARLGRPPVPGLLRSCDPDYRPPSRVPPTAQSRTASRGGPTWSVRRLRRAPRGPDSRKRRLRRSPTRG